MQARTPRWHTSKMQGGVAVLVAGVHGRATPQQCLQGTEGSPVRPAGHKCILHNHQPQTLPLRLPATPLSCTLLPQPPGLPSAPSFAPLQHAPSHTRSAAASGAPAQPPGARPPPPGGVGWSSDRLRDALQRQPPQRPEGTPPQPGAPPQLQSGGPCCRGSRAQPQAPWLRAAAGRAG